jgi:hypothetical protein
MDATMFSLTLNEAAGLGLAGELSSGATLEGSEGAL